MRCPSLHKLALFTAVVLTAAAATACSSSGTGNGGTGSGLTSLTVDALAIPDAITLMIAQQDGFFKQQGLNVHVQTVAASNNTTAALEAHTLNITSENYVGLYEQEQTHPDLKLRVIADDLQAAPGVFELMVPKGSNITSVAQLKGKKIAFPGLGISIGPLSTDVLLNSYHLGPDSYTPVPIPFPEMPAALAQGEIDAAFVTEPFITIMEKAGGHPLSDLMTGPMSNFPISCWVTSGWFEQHDAKTVAAFQRAIVQAQQVAASNQPLVRKLLPSYIKGLQPPIANVMALGTFNTTLSLTRMQRVADIMEEYSELPKNFDVKAMYLPNPLGTSS